MTYEEMETQIREITDPVAINEDPRLMVAAMARSTAIGELAALRVAAYNFRFYKQGEGNFKGPHLVMAQVMEGPVERLEQVVEETIVALARLTADIENCECETCKQEGLREAAPYN